MRGRIKAILGPDWQFRAHRLSRLRWLTKYRALRALQPDVGLRRKLAFVLLLVGHHFWLGHLVKVFASDANAKSHVFYRWINEIPLLYLIAIVVLVVVKPF